MEPSASGANGTVVAVVVGRSFGAATISPCPRIAVKPYPPPPPPPFPMDVSFAAAAAAPSFSAAPFGGALSSSLSTTAKAGSAAAENDDLEKIKELQTSADSCGVSPARAAAECLPDTLKMRRRPFVRSLRGGGANVCCCCGQFAREVSVSVPIGRAKEGINYLRCAKSKIRAGD